VAADLDGDVAPLRIEDMKRVVVHIGHWLLVFELAMAYPKAQTIHLVMDNLNIHGRKSVTDLLGEQVGGEVWNRFTVHHTPTPGSWLNQAEIEIGILSRQCLGNRRIPDLKRLRTEVRAWNRQMNRNRTRINWKFDRKAARRQFGYKRKSITRSRTSCEGTLPGCQPAQMRIPRLSFEPFPAYSFLRGKQRK